MKSPLFLAAVLVAAQASASPQLQDTFLKHTLLEDPPLIPQIHTGHSLLEESTTELKPDTVIFPEVSRLPKPLQWFFAGLWIVLLGSLPFIIPIIEQKPVTKTQFGVGTAMLVVLFGGLWLFTNIILFQSIHFKTIRPLTIIECIYFMTQVITTVGYGDITPAKPRGQVFVGFYVLGALTVICMLIYELTNHIVHLTEAYKERRFAANNPNWKDSRVRDLSSLIKPEKPSPIPLLTSLAIFAFLDICWIVFFSTYPGEGKTVFQALYMSVITLSSVGLGFFTPVTEAGMVFGAFWMLMGTTALVSVIGNFTALMVKFNEYERFKEESRDQAVALLETVVQKSDEVTELQFLKFALLQINSVSKGSLDHIDQAWVNLKPTNGSVHYDVVEKSLIFDEDEVEGKAEVKAQ